MKNYAIKNLNGWQNVEGKIFLGQELGMTGAEAKENMDEIIKDRTNNYETDI